MRSFWNVLMPRSRTVEGGNRSRAPTSTTLVFFRSSTALGPGTTAPTRAALACIRPAGTAPTSVEESGAARQTAPAKQETAVKGSLVSMPAITAQAIPPARPARPSHFATLSLRCSEKLCRRKPRTSAVGRLTSRWGSGSPRPSVTLFTSSSSAT